MNRFNTARTPESITNWMRRHKDVIEGLRAEILEGELPLEEISQTVFESGTFEAYKSVVIWTLDMKRRNVGKWSTQLSCLKRVCQGIRPSMDPITSKKFKGSRKGKKYLDLKDHGWVYKHPERFSLEDAEKYQDMMLEYYPDVDTSSERQVMRDFLKSKGVDRWDTIPATKHKSTGRYARLYCIYSILQAIFDYLKKVCYEAYVVDLFMYTTGTRITATLKARLEDIREVSGIYDIQIIDKGNKKWNKYICPELLEEIKLLTGYPEKTAGKIFTLTDDDMSEYNKEAYEIHFPELFVMYPDYRNWNHFWRHMFAQHMLRATGWNYAIVAALGGWDIKSLEESYGKAPAAQIKQWGITQLPKLFEEEKQI